MKIGFVLDDSLDSTDGVQQYVLSLGKWLAQQGHEVHYLVGKTTRTDLPNMHSLSRNITVRFNGNRMSIPLPAPRRAIRALLAREQFDALHVQMPYSPFMAGRIIGAAPRGTRIIGTFHILPLDGLSRWGAMLLARWTRRATARMDYILSVSEPARQFAAGLGIASTALPNVITAKRFSGAHPLPQYEDTFNIVFLGRLVRRKGCRQLLQAVRLWRESTTCADVRVLVCGAGPEGDELKQWSDFQGLGDVVSFVGFVSEDQKANYLASADIAVFPALGGESFGIVLLEAMASGAGVVIGGNNPGYQSVLGSDTPVVFDPTDTEKFAALLEQLYADKNLRTKLHNQQKTLVAHYDVDVVGQKLLSYYQNKG